MFSIGSKRWPGISKVTEEFGEVLEVCGEFGSKYPSISKVVGTFGKVLVVCGKLMGSRGEIAHWDGSDLKERLELELGDALAAVEFVIDKCALNRDVIYVRRNGKRKLFEHWHATNPKTETP